MQLNFAKLLIYLKEILKKKQGKRENVCYPTHSHM